MKSVATSFYPFYLFSKAFGVFPKSFSGPIEKGCLKIKFTDILLPLLSITLNLYFLHKVTNGTYIQDDSSILTIAWNYSLVYGLLATLIQNIYQMIHSVSIARLVKLLYNCDQTFAKLVATVDHKKHKFFVCLVIAFCLVLNLVKFLVFPAISAFSGKIFKHNMAYVCAVSFVAFYNCFYAVQLALANFALKDRFRIFNDVLR